MNKTNISAYGITYRLPQAHLLHATPLGLSEFAGRTCYNSFDKSEHESIKELNSALSSGIETDIQNATELVEKDVNTKGSDLLHQLAHVYFHSSVLEHITFNFIIKNISRMTLHELARHRLASYSVQSTRYTLSDIINWFVITKQLKLDTSFFIDKIDKLDILVTDDREYNAIEIGGMFNKLNHQWIVLGEDNFKEKAIAKSILDQFNTINDADIAFELLSSKAKKNVGDYFKTCVPETTSVDLAFSINLRSLKNFLDLRLSGAAFFQMQWLAHAIYNQIPENYLKLVVKDGKREQFSKLDLKIQSGEWA